MLARASRVGPKAYVCSHALRALGQKPTFARTRFARWAESLRFARSRFARWAESLRLLARASRVGPKAYVCSLALRALGRSLRFARTRSRVGPKAYVCAHALRALGQKLTFARTRFARWAESLRCSHALRALGSLVAQGNEWIDLRRTAGGDVAGE